MIKAQLACGGYMVRCKYTLDLEEAIANKEKEYEDEKTKDQTNDATIHSGGNIRQESPSLPTKDGWKH